MVIDSHLFNLIMDQQPSNPPLPSVNEYLVTCGQSPPHIWACLLPLKPGAAPIHTLTPACVRHMQSSQAFDRPTSRECSAWTPTSGPPRRSPSWPCSSIRSLFFRGLSQRCGRPHVSPIGSDLVGAWARVKRMLIQYITDNCTMCIEIHTAICKKCIVDNIYTWVVYDCRQTYGSPYGKPNTGLACNL